MKNTLWVHICKNKNKGIISYLIANWLQLNSNNCNFVLVQVVKSVAKKVFASGNLIGCNSLVKMIVYLCTWIEFVCKLYHWDFQVCIDKVVRTHRVVQQSECGLQCSQLLVYVEERMVLCICRCVIISNRSTRSLEPIGTIGRIVDYSLRKQEYHMLVV